MIGDLRTKGLDKPASLLHSFTMIADQKIKTDNDQQRYFSVFDEQLGKFLSFRNSDSETEIRQAVSLAGRQLREGHVCVRLPDFAGRAGMSEEAEGGQDVYPELAGWIRALRNTSCVGRPGEFKPLILDDSGRLYFHRYWQYEKDFAEFIGKRIGSCTAPGISTTRIQTKLADYFSQTIKENYLPPALAAVMALMRRFLVITGSPGTGKTTSIAKILAFLLEVEQKPLRIVFCAPTGKAASRLEDAIKRTKKTFACPKEVAEAIPDEAMTLHRLLGSLRYSPYFYYNRKNPLPYDVVVVDEASMMDLPLASKLSDALLPDARLFLLGDKDQLASVEAGAVLGGICYPEALNIFSTGFAEKIRVLSGLHPETSHAPAGMQDGIVELHRNYRFPEDSGIGSLSAAVRSGAVRQALDLLEGKKEGDVRFYDLSRYEDISDRVRKTVLAFYRPYLTAVRHGFADIDNAFDHLEAFRILCALRVGQGGTQKINAWVEKFLTEAGLIRSQTLFYTGRPVMITQNDYRLGLYNGDVGIVLADPDEPTKTKVFFRDSKRGLRRLSTERLPAHETVWAMTVHKSQGSEFGKVAIVLPPVDLPLLTRELLYTGITRARHEAEIWAPRNVLAATIQKRINRQSGLTDALMTFSTSAENK